MNESSLQLDRLTISDLARLLNSSSYSHGAISATQIRTLLDLSGFAVRSSSSEKINFLRFASWLITYLLTHEQKIEEKKIKRARAYIQQRKSIAENQEIAIEYHRDLGEFNFCEDAERKEYCRNSFRDFCLTYLPQRFELPFGKMHDSCIMTIEQVVLNGGQYAFAMPRGSGKTTLLEAAAIWATVYSHRRFVVIISSSEAQAESFLQSIKAEIETNEILNQDFRDLTYPIRRANGRSITQTYKKQYVKFVWKPKQISFPNLENSELAGNTIRISGINSSIRGIAVNFHGQKIRPDFVIIDDPQSDESAHSFIQTNTRENTINGAILGLSGPNKSIAAILAGTIIQRDDLLDRIVDKKRNPQWNGYRYPMLTQFPKRLDLWQKYYDILTRSENGREEATRYYRANRQIMDDGSETTWEYRHSEVQDSAIQHAMELYLRAPQVFFAEYQNQPKNQQSLDELNSIENIEKNIASTPRYISPNDALFTTVGIDIQSEIIFYSHVAWNRDGGGTIIDYGTFPDQLNIIFSAASPPRRLSDLYAEYTTEQRIYLALETLIGNLLKREYVRSNGSAIKLERILVDSGWQSNLVYRWSRESQYRQLIVPSKGYAITASAKPISEWPIKIGDRIGNNWRLRAATGQYLSQLLIYDANYWKTILAERFATIAGSSTSLTLYHADQSEHQLFASHLSAESPIKTASSTRETIEWRIKPTRPDNHWLDACVLAIVAASVSGVNNSIFKQNIEDTSKTRAQRKWSEIANEQREKLRKKRSEG